MHLSEAERWVPFKVLRDGSFESLGKVGRPAERMLTFVESEKYVSRAAVDSCVTCVITSEKIASGFPEKLGVAVSENPRYAFYLLHNRLATETDFYHVPMATQISETAVVHPSAQVGTENVIIGNGTIVEPGVSVFGRCIIGDNVIIRSGTTIGSQGFEFTRVDGRVLPVHHVGGVRIHDYVEIKSNCVVSRGLFNGFTEIGEESKIDSLVHVAHNVRIGKRCLIAACAMIGGNVTVGDDVWIGPGVCISNALAIGSGARLTMGSVVVKNVRPGQQVTGHFAVDHERFLAYWAREVRS